MDSYTFDNVFCERITYEFGYFWYEVDNFVIPPFFYQVCFNNTSPSEFSSIGLKMCGKYVVRWHMTCEN